MKIATKFSSTVNLLRTSYAVGLITVVSKSLFVSRELLVAWTFGRSQALEAYLLAYLIPFSVTNALASGLVITFVPKFIKHREDGQREIASELYASLFAVLILAASLVIAILILTNLFLASVFAPGFSEESLGLMQSVLFFTGAAAILTAVSDLWKGILDSVGGFKKSSAVSIVTPGIMTLMLLLFPENGVWVLTIGLLLGITAELAILAFILRRHDVRLLPRFRNLSTGVRSQVSDWWKVVVSLFLFNLMTVINGSMATGGLQAGGFSILNYAKKVVTLPNDLGAITYTNVLIPHLSRLAAKDRWKHMKGFLNRWLLIVFITTTPVVLVLYYFSNEIVAFLFERGAFSSEDAMNTAIVLRFYVVQIPFFISFFLMVRTLAVIGESDSTLFFGVLGVVLTVVCNLILIGYIGVAGIALSSSVVFFFLAIALYLYINLILGRKTE